MLRYCRDFGNSSHSLVYFESPSGKGKESAVDMIKNTPLISNDFDTKKNPPVLMEIPGPLDFAAAVVGSVYDNEVDKKLVDKALAKKQEQSDQENFIQKEIEKLKAEVK